MRLRTFTAPDMPSAMKLVREAMGDDAIIISSEPLNGKSITVTAALDEDDDGFVSPAPTKEERNLQQNNAAADLRSELQNILRFHNLPDLFVAKMLQKTPESELRNALAAHRIGGDSDPRRLHLLALEKILGGYFSFAPFAFTDKNMRLMLIGTPGIGKTLTIAKIAAKLAMEKLPFTVITTDNKRAGGVEQLQAFTNILGKELHVATSRTELWKMVHAQQAGMRILIDTAGCNPYDNAQWQELQSQASIEGVEPVLVLPAGGDALEAIDMVETFCTLPIKRMLVTRADSTRRFGGVMAAAAAHNLAFSHISNSASMVDSLHEAGSALMAQLLLRYQLQT
jgi:flagellar biosynthesis protein FlhF